MPVDANWIGKQIGESQRRKNREEKERKEYNIGWKCKSSEKTNKWLSYIAIALLFIPILMIAIWWEYITETNDLGVFIGGISLLYILIPIIIVGFGLILYTAIKKSICRTKTPK